MEKLINTAEEALEILDKIKSIIDDWEDKCTDTENMKLSSVDYETLCNIKHLLK